MPGALLMHPLNVAHIKVGLEADSNLYVDHDMYVFANDFYHQFLSQSFAKIDSADIVTMLGVIERHFYGYIVFTD